MINLSEALKNQREAVGLNQPELAKAIKTSQQNISRWENGQTVPGIDFCIALAKFYGCTLDELVGLSDNDTGEYEQSNSAPTKIQTQAIAFAKEFGDILADKNYIEMSKLYKAITPELRALVLGYIIGILQRHNINTTDIIGY